MRVVAARIETLPEPKLVLRPFSFNIVILCCFFGEKAGDNLFVLWANI